MFNKYLCTLSSKTDLTSSLKDLHDTDKTNNNKN